MNDRLHGANQLKNENYIQSSKARPDQNRESDIQADKEMGESAS